MNGFEEMFGDELCGREDSSLKQGITTKKKKGAIGILLLILAIGVVAVLAVITKGEIIPDILEEGVDGLFEAFPKSKKKKKSKEAE